MTAHLERLTATSEPSQQATTLKKVRAFAHELLLFSRSDLSLGAELELDRFLEK